MFVRLGRLAIVAVAVAGVVAPLAPASATKTICVGLVVDARSLGGPASTDCANVPDGSTGYDVLRRAGHTVGFRRDGIICTIDDRPADGCSKTDALHYWAYFHREPKSSSWTYSDEGANTYKPENGETEGWVWRDGNQATPENVPYTTICPQPSSPTPRPSVTQASPASTPSPTVRAPTPSSAALPHGRHRAKHKQHSPSPSPSTSPTTTTTTSPPVTIAAANSEPHNGSSSAPWGLIAGVAAIAVVGGAAAWQLRRRGSE